MNENKNGRGAPRPGASVGGARNAENIQNGQNGQNNLNKSKTEIKSETASGKNTAKVERIRLPDGTYGIYMGQTGIAGARRAARGKKGAPPRGAYGASSRANYANHADAKKQPQPHNPNNPNEIARNGQNRKREPEDKSPLGALRAAADRFRAWRLGISIDADSIVKGVIVALFILVFTMLQTTVFSRFRPFGAVPDLMLSLVMAIGASEGEKWGGVSGLICAFVIEATGSASNVTLLPLLYVPCGFFVGVIMKIYFKDSVIVRLIYTSAACLLRCVVTVIYVFLGYKNVDVGIMLKGIVVPEFFSTLLMSALPNLLVWLTMKPFHKSRAERVG